MRWLRISRLRLRPWLERMRCRADNLTTGRRGPQNGETALVGSIRTESKYAIDPRKAGRISQRLFTETLRSLRLHKRRDKGDGIVGERCGANRILSIAGAISSGEISEAGRVGRCVPASVDCSRRDDPRIVPQPAAQQLHPLKIYAACSECLHHLRHSVSAIRNKNAVDLVRRLRNAASG